MISRRPAVVRVYFDADVLGLAKLLCQVRPDFTYPGDPGGRIKRRERLPCPITLPETADVQWIPIVAERGWLIVTRDAKIQERLPELEAVRTSGARMLNIASRDATNTWAQLEVFMTRWREIEPLIDMPGPFIRILTRGGSLREIDLDPRA